MRRPQWNLYADAKAVIVNFYIRRVCSPEREKRDSGPQQPSAAEHFAAQLPGINDENLSSFAIQLKKETEALLKPVTYKAEEKPRITAVGCKWMPPTSG